LQYRISVQSLHSSWEGLVSWLALNTLPQSARSCRRVANANSSDLNGRTVLWKSAVPRAALVRDIVHVRSTVQHLSGAISSTSRCSICAMGKTLESRHTQTSFDTTVSWCMFSKPTMLAIHSQSPSTHHPPSFSCWI